MTSEFRNLTKLCIDYELNEDAGNLSANDLLSTLATFYGTKNDNQARVIFESILRTKRQRES